MEDSSEQLRAVLSRAFLPGDELLTPEVFDDLRAEVTRVHLSGKEVLFSLGDESDSLYVVMTGRLRALGPDQSGQEMTRDIIGGELLGEMGAISGEVRSMTVYAVRDSDLAMLSKSAFERLMSRHPQLMMGILATLMDRLRADPPEKTTAPSCFALAVIPVGRGRSFAEFPARLAKSFESLGPTLLVNRDAVNERTGDPGAADAPPGSEAGERILACLNQQEASHCFLVYAGDPEHEEWTRRCERQADHVLLVADADDDPEPKSRENDLVWRDHGPTSAQRSLALVHREGAAHPTGTAAWLDPRDLHRHYHVRWDHPEDFDRLARSVADRGVGLVLGGGGARGFSQIGVIQALRESGIPIDFVGGASMGAIVAAACAMGWDTPTMIGLGREAFVDSKAFREYTLPLVSLLGGRRLERVTRKIFGETEIEDLWTPQFSVSCNLTASEAVVHQRGKLWRAVRASGSLPGVLAPMLDEGQLLVDGGVLDNLPGDIMKSLSGGPVVVVDVTPEEDLRARCETVPSAWRMLRDRFLAGQDPGMPGIVDILMRATTLNSVRVASEVKRDADLYLHPAVESYGMLEFDAIESLVEAGYEHAMRRIEELGGAERVRAELVGDGNQT